MTESFELSSFFPGITAESVYRAWLDSAGHTTMTGSPAQVEPHVGETFTAWEGYISGANLELHPCDLDKKQISVIVICAIYLDKCNACQAYYLQNH